MNAFENEKSNLVKIGARTTFLEIRFKIVLSRGGFKWDQIKPKEV